MFRFPCQPERVHPVGLRQLICCLCEVHNVELFGGCSGDEGRPGLQQARMERAGVQALSCPSTQTPDSTPQGRL